MQATVSPTKVMQTSNIKEISNYSIPQTEKGLKIALFDFDDMLVFSGTREAYHLGGLKWRDEIRKMIDQLKQEGKIRKEALLFDCLSLFIAKTLPAHAVEGKETAALIKTLEALGYTVMIFTARGRSGENAWYKLDVCGVDFLTKEQMLNSGIEISQPSQPMKHPTIFDNFMICAQNDPKEKLISKLFNERIFPPELIDHLIFADDKKDSVEKVGEAVIRKEISFTGVHYTHVQELEKQEYHFTKSIIQLVNLLATRVLLTKEECEKRFSSMSKENEKDFVKQILIQLNEALQKEGIYDQKGLSTNEMYEKIKAVAITSFAK